MFDLLNIIYITIGITMLMTILFLIGLVNDYSWYKKMVQKNIEFHKRNRNMIGWIDNYRLKADKNNSLKRSIHLNIKKQVFIPKLKTESSAA